MSTFIKNRIINKENFKSGQIGPLAYLVHKMSEKGNYTVTVSDNKIPLMIFAVNCDPANSENSVNVDLSRPLHDQQIPEPVKLNSEYGLLLFYNSMEYVDWEINITSQADHRQEFSSLHPRKGDLMAFNLIKPGKYSLESASKQASEIEVLHPEEIRDKRMHLRSDVLTNRFSHADFKLKQHKIIQPGQGMIIEYSDELTTFTLNLKEAKSAKVPFAERLREELKKNLNAINKDPKLKQALRKKYWSRQVNR